jgi:hypothetical protein
MGHEPQLIVWECGEHPSEVALAGEEHTFLMSSVTAWFTTSEENVIARVYVAADEAGTRVQGATFLPYGGDEEPSADELSAAMRSFDAVAALRVVVRQCSVRRLPADGVLPEAVVIGDGHPLSTHTLSRITGPGPGPSVARVQRTVRKLMADYADKRGLPGAVAAELGVSVRTAHRYIAAVRAEQEGTHEVRRYETKLEAK